MRVQLPKKLGHLFAYTCTQTCPTELMHASITSHYGHLQLSEGWAESLVELQSLSRAGIG